ncbi:glycosyltransferase [Parabacteroides goldsteinii]|uniref:glycosyltransferase n=1 Tax=Parabacteroides goldsteinii TaxID=328812 RepID=UPI00241BFABE|nr:glycosyltransferase [Parabacteroides goldsteinii]
MKLAPIVLFVYNRIIHTKKVVTALLQNEYASESDLIIYSDGFKNEIIRPEVEAVRDFLNSITGFKSVTIFKRSENWGLANNIIDGVTSVVNQYGKIIVLEDDLLVSRYFLKYMNEALDFYENEKKVVSIHGYVYPVRKSLPETFFIKGADCWGWATWKRGWDLFCSDGKVLLNEIDKQNLKKEFDFNNSYPYYRMLKHQIEGKNNSWAVRWYASAFLYNKLTLYPGRSLVNQIGMDGSGTHCDTNEMFDVSLTDSPILLSNIDVQESKQGRDAFIYYFRYVMFYYKVKARLKRIFKY